MSWRLRLLAMVVAVCTGALLSVGLTGGPGRAMAQSAQAVYALPGTLRVAENQPFATILVTFDGNQYGLVGETPAVEQEIVRLRDLGPTVVVKVWGELYPAGISGGSTTPEILVRSIISDSPTVPTPAPTEEPPAPTPVAQTPAPANPSITVSGEVINVRSGPGTNYPVVYSLTQGSVCAIVGRNAASTWWQVTCPNGVAGWVYNEIVAASGDTSSVPVVEAEPPPPPPVSGAAWRGLFYANRDLAGEPVQVAEFSDLNFNWGTGAPVSGVPADNFSARFERVLSFPTGNYLIQVTVDDGVRVYVDQTEVISDYREGASRTLSTQRLLSGSHTFRVEYMEAGGNAVLQLNVGLVTTANDWTASYFTNPQLAGSPALVRGEPRAPAPDYLRLDWSTGSPAAGTIPVDNWSARWEGDFYFEGGDYAFNAAGDDGIRLYIDGIRVLDAWGPGWNTPNNIFRGLGAGNHRITVEYYDNTYVGNLRVWWYRINAPSGGDDDDDDDGRERD